MNEDKFLNKKEAKFIVFEGLDGSGQSTQSNLLKNFLIKKKIKVILTKEPTSVSQAGKKIKAILSEKIKIDPKKLQKLFAEDRKWHLENIIIPSLKKNKWVISDRYFFSSFAYGASEGIDLRWLIKINKNFLFPDLTFILKVKPQICILRIEKRGAEKTFFEKKEKLEKVFSIYKTFPNKFRNIVLINGEKKKQEVFKDIKKIIVSNFLENNNNLKKILKNYKKICIK